MSQQIDEPVISDVECPQLWWLCHYCLLLLLAKLKYAQEGKC